MNKYELNEFEKKALDQFMSGKNLFSRDGAFAPLLRSFIEKSLEAEMESHLDPEARLTGNKRNGKGSKTLKTAHGLIEIETPEDRHSSFDPQIVKKRQTVLTDNLADKIIGMYGLGMSTRDISSHIKEIYDSEISPTMISEITDRIIPEIKAWQNRPLESMYCIVWLDAMHFKVKHEEKVQHKALYNILGVT
jgi:transposase-like protein